MLAVDVLDKSNTTHRDIKMENIIYNATKKQIKLIDFGFAVNSAKPLKLTCGSLMYMAPELFERGKEYRGPPIDIWACGVVLYAISTGHFPFAARTERDIITKIKRGIYHIPTDYPEQLKPILQMMFQVNPSKRATASDILVKL